MESVHGVDVSWMHRTTSNTLKDTKPTYSRESSKEKVPISTENGSAKQTKESPTSPKAIPTRPGFSRNVSAEKTAITNGAIKSPSLGTTSRRNSWLSSISSKFSPTSHQNATAPVTPPVAASPIQEENVIPLGPHTPKHAVLPHGAVPQGDVPYTPAPPKSTQPGFLQSALRRLSSSSGQLSASSKGTQAGICERKVLNVDHNRQRCHISELDQSKLRRVAFCVDVEIASGPRYIDDPVEEDKNSKKDKKVPAIGEKPTSKTGFVPTEKAGNEDIQSPGVQLPKALEKQALANTIEIQQKDSSTGEKDTTKKREKKKRSEEERKARKEKKRKLAEANGTVPVELVRDGANGSDSSIPGAVTPKTQASPTTDPLRIYRRCCQLRETPILKKITEQLATFTSSDETPGVVTKLDLTDYWLQLPDLITLGDYLAVVPIKELVMENCGLTDEGIRVILAGLLAAKPVGYSANRVKANIKGETLQGGVVERLVFTNNTNIGRDGWRYICLFINMCRSLKSMDLSKVPFPQAPANSTSPHPQHQHVGMGHLSRTPTSSSATSELSSLLSKAIGERLAGQEFELLNVAECGISTEQLSDLIDGVIKSGLRRLGIAGNNITSEGIRHVCRFLQSGSCEGLDLGGNNLKDLLGVIAESVHEDSPLYALSLRECSLTPDSLWTLFPALVKLKNFRFIDLSQNHSLFETDPSAIQLLRRYLPKMPVLKRIHLTDVSMTPEQAIALAEILPDTPSLAHVSLLENPKLGALANAKDEANQEEACALYASLMAAVRVSKTIICVDIEVPSSDSSEVVKALAKQVVAYCLYNMERGPVAEISEAVTATTDPHGGEKEVAVPDVLLHLVGHTTDNFVDHDDTEPAPDDDYVIGGTGVVKALGICLRNRGNDSRRPSSDRPVSSSDMPVINTGSETPKVNAASGKAKQMSKNLLWSARKIRARLQPALMKEARGDQNSYQRLLFLDNTLKGMIKRFEDEYPETRLPTSIGSPQLDPLETPISPIGSLESPDIQNYQEAQTSDADESALVDAPPSDDEYGTVRPVLSRHNSDVSIASRAFTEEEGRMHRFGQKFRRDILKPEQEDHHHGTTGAESEPPNLRLLRAMVEGLGGEEIRSRIESEGQDVILEDLSNEASELKKRLIEQDPESWRKFAESQETARKNSQVSKDNESAVE
ncbi:hypothetical protein B0O99DRAFT_384118 [Bisporella sp. PMI_857]|nr:hypothetical protein B0O99DRAFT_384118 [Bisporella sp. PMI_857]